MIEFTKKEIEEAIKYYGWDISKAIKKHPEEFTKCEICGRILLYWTSVYCENECESKVNPTLECRFCWDCLEEMDGCPICGGHDFGR